MRLSYEAPVPRRRTYVREAKELERLGLAETPLCRLLGGEPPEPDQPRLVGVELQAELREPVAKVRPEPLGIGRDLGHLEGSCHVVEEHEQHPSEISPSRMAPKY